MKLKQYSTIGLALVAAAGLLFAGCSKKVEVTAAKPAPAPAAGAKMPGATVSPVSPVTPGVQEPSSHSVYFAFDSSELDAAVRGILDANAAWLMAHPGMSITIEGNCDERGTREYNLALGQRRADSVRDYLTAQGVSSGSMDTVSFGEERPACQGTGEACWAQNRRADIVTR